MKYKVAKMNRTTCSLSHIFNTCHMCSRDTVTHVQLPSTCMVVTSYHWHPYWPISSQKRVEIIAIAGSTNVNFNIGKGIETCNCIFYLIDGFWQDETNSEESGRQVTPEQHYCWNAPYRNENRHQSHDTQKIAKLVPGPITYVNQFYGYKFSTSITWADFVTITMTMNATLLLD